MTRSSNGALHKLPKTCYPDTLVAACRGFWVLIAVCASRWWVSCSRRVLVFWCGGAFVEDAPEPLGWMYGPCSRNLQNSAPQAASVLSRSFEATFSCLLLSLDPHGSGTFFAREYVAVLVRRTNSKLPVLAKASPSNPGPHCGLRACCGHLILLLARGHVLSQFAGGETLAGWLYRIQSFRKPPLEEVHGLIHYGMCGLKPMCQLQVDTEVQLCLP